jgi:hypothetical protein
MNKKLRVKLINALKLAGMSEGLASMFENKTEAEINAFISDLPVVDTDSDEPTLTVDELATSPLLVQAVEKLGFDKILSMSKVMQSAHDKKVDSGIKTFKKRFLQDDYNEEGEENKPTTKLPDDTPEYVKAMMSKLDSVTQELDSIKNKNQVNSKLDEAKGKMEKSKLPKNLQTKWISRIDLKSETSVDDQIEALETEYAEVYTDIAGTDTYSFSDRTDKNQSKMTTADEKELAEMAKQL